MDAEIEIREHDRRALVGDELAAFHHFVEATRAEYDPGCDVNPLETFERTLRNIPAMVVITTWCAWSNGELVGWSGTGFEDSPENTHLIAIDLEVAPHWRRSGLGTRLLDLAVGCTEAVGRRLVFVATQSSVPSGAAFARAAGAKVGSSERVSQLKLSDVDWPMIERWQAEGPSRAQGYELIALTEGSIPDDLLDAYLTLYRVTNTAPRDDLDFEDGNMTAEQLREHERSALARGYQVRSYLARHQASGAFAGFTELGYQPARPSTIHQLWTAVHPDHRGHALGKWLKSAALLDAVAAWPDAVAVETENAYSNDAMLGINIAMGFAETRTVDYWQVPTSQLRTFVDSKLATPQT